MYEFSEDYEKIFKNIVTFSNRYAVTNNIKAFILGVSGGIDSALVAAIMQHTHIPLIGVRIPLEGNKQEELSRAYVVSRAFCDSHHYNNRVSKALNDLIEELSVEDSGFELLTKIRKGNIKARLRMICLFDMAKSHDGLVLSTDNFTEYLLGFWTLHGDVGNFAPIQHLWKTEVYGLAEYLESKYKRLGEDNKAHALRVCINAIPTDGLGISTSDFDQILPSYNRAELKSPKQRYNEVDRVLYEYINGGTVSKDDPIILRHLASEFKRNDPISINRDGLLK